MQLYELTISEAHRLLKNREISAVELTRSVLGRIGAVEAQVDAFLTILEAPALAQAAAADRAIAAGECRPLAGIPVGIKDNMCTRGVLTTCSSKILSNFVPPYDATVAGKLRAAGRSARRQAQHGRVRVRVIHRELRVRSTRNPWDLERVPGGSSGGSAAAVSAGMVPITLGSDTGGSIRQPGALCGVVAMKPTYGRVSRYGCVAFASSLDQIGPFTKSVEECALALNAICGKDPMDATSVLVRLRTSPRPCSGRRGMKVALASRARDARMRESPPR